MIPWSIQNKGLFEIFITICVIVACNLAVAQDSLSGPQLKMTHLNNGYLPAKVQNIPTRKQMMHLPAKYLSDGPIHPPMVRSLMMLNHK